MIRMIFSTVRAPHEPALTVESLAISATGRPSMCAMPVTTPSAGRSPASALANNPSSTNEPSSTSSRIRSRANSLPFSAFASWYFGGRRASISRASLAQVGHEPKATDDPIGRASQGSAAPSTSTSHQRSCLRPTSCIVPTSVNPNRRCSATDAGLGSAMTA